MYMTKSLLNKIIYKPHSENILIFFNIDIITYEFITILILNGLSSVLFIYGIKRLSTHII